MDGSPEAPSLGKVTVIYSDMVELEWVIQLGLERVTEAPGRGREAALGGYGCTLGRKKPRKVVFLVILRGMPKGAKLENLWISLITASV